MTWWEALIPAVIGALAIRLVAVLSPKYFSWVEIFSEDMDEGKQTRTVRRRAMASRLAVPFVTVGLTRLFWQQDMSYWSAAVIGLLTSFLILWPVLFHGLPYGLLRKDWLIYPVYGSFVVMLMGAGMFGWGISEIILKSDDPVKLILTSGGEIAAGAVLMGIFAGVFDRGTAQLGRTRDSRSFSGHDYLNDEENE